MYDGTVGVTNLGVTLLWFQPFIMLCFQHFIRQYRVQIQVSELRGYWQLTLVVTVISVFVKDIRNISLVGNVEGLLGTRSSATT